MAWTAAETAKFNAFRNDMTNLETKYNGLIEQIKILVDGLDGNPTDDRAALNAMFDKYKVRPGTAI